jgi:hypothetical protein
MEYYIPPPQYNGPNFMSTLQGFAGLANMADQAAMAPINKKLAEANLQAVQQGVEQSKLMNPVQLATARTNLGILGNSLRQQEKLNPIQLATAQNTKTLGDQAVALGELSNELQLKKAETYRVAIAEVQANPSSKAAQDAIVALSVLDPSAAAGIERAKAQYTSEQQRFVNDAQFNAFIGMRNNSPEAAAAALTQARDAAINSGQDRLVKAFDADLQLLQKDPQAAYAKFTLLAASSPDHRQAMDAMNKVETLPSQVQAGVRKYVELADAAQKQGNTIGDLLRRWQEVPPNEAGGVSKLLSLGRMATANETPTDVLRKETEAAFNLERLKAFKEEIGSMGIRNLKEFETALAGKSDPYSKKDQVISRLERILEFTEREQAYQQANADWLTAFRGSSVATRDAVVNGIQIPKGSNVQNYKKAIAQSMFPDKPEPTANVPVTVTMPDGKVGQIPSDQVEAFKKKYPGAKFQ